MTSRPLPSTALLAAIAGLALALSGCGALFMSDEEALWRNTPAERHAIGFRSGQATLGVELPPLGAELSTNQQADLREFLTAYQSESTGALRISLPTASGDGGRAGSALRQVMAIADDLGIAPQSVRVSRHAPHGGSTGLALAYPRRVVVPPQCHDWSEDLGRNHQRVHHPEFGCATQRNLALNVADPRHLQRPASEQPRSAERRSADWAKYVGPPAAASGAPSEPKPKAPPKNQPAPVN